MSQSWNSGWMQWNTLAQTGAPAAPQAGPAPAAPQQAAPTEAGATQPGTLGTPAGKGSGQASPFGGGFMFIILAMVLIMLFTSIMAGRKDKKKRAELMSAIKKHDKVQMIGGIIGTVSEITDDEVVLKVEEGRIRFHKSSVQGVLSSAKTKGDSSIAEVKGEPTTTSV